LVAVAVAVAVAVGVAAGIPVPVSGTEPSLAFTESLVDIDALRAPSALGVKVIVTAQLLFGANKVLNAAQVLFVIEKSPELVPVIATANPDSGTPPTSGLVIVTVWEAEV